MTIHVALTHRTLYRYDRAVQLSPHVVRLRPAAHSRTPVLAYSLRVSPGDHFINWQQDPFGNYLARLVFPERAHELSIEVDLVADMTVINPFDFFLEDYATRSPFDYEPALRRDLAPYLEVRESGPRLRRWLDSVDRTPVRTVDALVALNQRLAREIAYTIRMEPGVQTCEQTLERALGSCRDTGWLLVQVLRHLGFAARFVSGYLVQLVADQKPLDGPAGPERDFTDLHAWAEVYIPGAGWIGLDPTSGLFAGEGHIPLACTPDPEGAAPVSGYTDTCEVVAFEHENTVRRLREDPRVTLPYSEAQWSAIDALGEQVDAELTAGDVRLTMGGEPTFVSVDDMESAEWTVAADGPDKRRKADELVRRLRDAFGAGGVLYHGQGKWYPGEPLPRWMLAVFWRHDGVPVWRDATLLADTSRNLGHGEPEARAFAQELVERLGLPALYLQPGYEDAFHYLLVEQRLPDNVDPLSPALRDPLERKRLARLLDRGLDVPTGYALPLAWDFVRSRWTSGQWRFRRGHMALVPGDSPMGLRLPLESLPVVPVEQRHRLYDRSLLEPLPQLPADAQRHPREGGHPGARPAWTGCGPDGRQRRRGRCGSRHGRWRRGRCPGRHAAARRRAAHRAVRRGTRRSAARVPAPAVAPRALARPRLLHRGHRRRARATGGDRGIRTAPRPAAGAAAGHARSGRDRGEHPPGRQLARTRAQHHAALRTGASHPPGHREIHARWASHGYRRGQSHHPRGPHSGRQPDAQASGSAAQPAHLLAEPSLALLPVLRPVHRPHQPGTPRRRGAGRGIA
jgi:transglutaminase-like putative cysteine protease